MRRLPPRSTRTDTLFPYRRSSDLLAAFSLQLTLHQILQRIDIAVMEDAGIEWSGFLLDQCLGQFQKLLVRLGIADVAEIRRGLVHFVGIAKRFQHHRSEEHTSELQSLMRISYAVFCLKKKKSRILYQ